MDWSESALIALYFAVSDVINDPEDGAIWVLDPLPLNERVIGDRVVLGFKDGLVNEMLRAIFNNRTEVDKVYAIYNKQYDRRQMVQHSQFTIHGNSECLTETDGSDSFLYKIIVPKELKQEMRSVLQVLKFTKSHIFPDLQNLAEDIKEKEYMK